MHNLNNLNILVTRPDDAGIALCQQIENLGGNAIHFPTITFSSLTHTDLFKKNLQQIKQQAWLIFTSLTAVSFSLSHIKPYLHLQHPQLAAVGASTAKALQGLSHLSVLFPEQDWSSESLLTLPPFISPKNQSIMIVKGLGGRTLLQTVLQERGAQVSLLIPYQRVLPNIDTTIYIDLLKKSKINVIIGASAEGVTNLKILLREDCWPQLLTIPLIVMSERIKVLAQHLGFQTIWVAEKGDYIQKIANMF